MSDRPSKSNPTNLFEKSKEVNSPELKELKPNDGSNDAIAVEVDDDKNPAAESPATPTPIPDDQYPDSVTAVDSVGAKNPNGVRAVEKLPLYGNPVYPSKEVPS